MMRITTIFFILILFISCDSSSNNDTNNFDEDYNFDSYQETSSIDCEAIKSECLNLIKNNAPDIIQQMQEYEASNNQEMNLENAMFCIKSINYLNKVGTMENEMKNNCPEVFSEYQNDLNSWLLANVLIYMINNSSQENESPQ
jgi:hypothetical protein